MDYKPHSQRTCRVLWKNAARCQSVVGVDDGMSQCVYVSAAGWPSAQKMSTGPFARQGILTRIPGSGLEAGRIYAYRLGVRMERTSSGQSGDGSLLVQQGRRRREMDALAR
jgi:hypothetical protein